MRSLVLRTLLMALAPVLIAGILLVAKPASAAFPGVNGKILFQTNRDSNQEIYMMNADGSQQVNLTKNFAVDNRGAWSADGQKIAFHSTRNGNFEIYSMDANGVTRLTFTAAVDFDPAWSPDGTKIVFDSSRDDASREIYVMNADGSNVTRLTFQTGFVEGMAAWSPDGTKIAFRSNRDGNDEIYVMNADGTGQINLTNNSASDAFPNWSPDGTKIAFNSDRDGNGEVYVMNADGTGQINLTNFPGVTGIVNDGAPAWSPDGTKIAFASNRDGNFEIYVMNADGTGQVNVSNNPAFDTLPDWGTPGLTCVDQSPPQLNVSLNPNVLTPPDRTMRTIDATVSVNDDCDPNPNVVLLSIVPSGPDIPNPQAGPLSGPDVVVIDIDEFQLRAELDADGTDRTYVVTYSAQDAAGRARHVSRNVVVSVPSSGGGP